jgi:carboxymethylenebutenolidase
MRTLPLYLATPKSGSGPGVIVLHSWWGLNPFFRSLCDRFAKAGFVALAPDLYSGQVATTESGARSLRAKVTATRRTPVYRQLIDAIDQLSHHESVTSPHVAVVGFSMGGHWALWLAQRPELPIRATVVFYAARNGDFSRSRSRFLFHFAEADAWVSAAGVNRLKRSMDIAATDVTYHVYPGTTHWFFESDRSDAFDKKAASLAWTRTLAFLNHA